MIIYGGKLSDSGYKTPLVCRFDFILPLSVAETRPKLRPLTSENSEFLKKLGLKLKKTAKNDEIQEKRR